VVQTCLKYCNAERRSQIALELKGNYLSLAKNTYSRFLVTKVLKYRSASKTTDFLCRISFFNPSSMI